MLMKENTGLIIIDIQGKLAHSVHDSNALISCCEKLIKGALALALPIISLEQNPEKLGPTVEALHLLLNTSPLISKFTFNACAEDRFIDKLKKYNVDTWLICGIESHICVYQTGIGLLNLGYKVELVSDCISSRTPTNKKLGINKLMNKGASITSLEMCLYELVKDCRSTEFKTILNLIR